MNSFIELLDYMEDKGNAALKAKAKLHILKALQSEIKVKSGKKINRGFAKILNEDITAIQNVK